MYIRRVKIPQISFMKGFHEVPYLIKSKKWGKVFFEKFLLFGPHRKFYQSFAFQSVLKIKNYD